MKNNITQEKDEGFFKKYKKWIVALVGLQLIPIILLVVLFGGGSIYLFLNNDVNFHPYKSSIIDGYRAGHSDGVKDKVGSIHSSLWGSYRSETRKLKKKVALERKEYLAQFAPKERSSKLAEMKLDNIKLPLQQELEKRFTVGLDFYAHRVKQLVSKESFNSDKEYKEALHQEAWKAGYENGYCAGISGDSRSSGLRSLEK